MISNRKEDCRHAIIKLALINFDKGYNHMHNFTVLGVDCTDDVVQMTSQGSSDNRNIIKQRYFYVFYAISPVRFTFKQDWKRTV